MALRKNTNNIVTITEEVKNTSVRVITITEDRLENVLNKHLVNMKKPKDVVAAFALVVTFIGILTTASFQDALGLNADSWKGIFVFATILSLLYLLYTGYNWFRLKTNVKSIIEDIKNPQE